jgi:hypothetical protein
MTSWRRNTATSYTLQNGSLWNDAISSGDSYLRVHIRWGFVCDSPTAVDMQALSTAIVTFGLCTTIGNGSETPPNPRTQSGDQAPPTQRWIYWETRAPVVSAIDYQAGVIAWRDSGATEPTSTKGQVLATGLGEGDSLNLWAVWDCPLNWSGLVGNAMLWHSLSILRKNTTP